MSRSASLQEILKQRISASGKITFAEFMDIALYHPIYGYYSSKSIKIGKRGDYYTSPSVHPVFGELICRQIEEMWNIAGAEDFSIVEMGAGDGTLCHDILACAKREYPSFYRVLRYLIIEESKYMREIQRERLDEVGLLNEKVLWVDYSDPVFEKGISGCFLSNELIDAFPVHIVEKRGVGVKEVFVDFYGNAFREVLDSPSTTEIQKYFSRLGIGLEEGQRAEVNLRALHWMRWISKALNRGFVLTIDYGYPAEEIYAPHRGRGTLLCYHRHRVSEDPFLNIGEQDMTSHVDFTTLMMIGEEVGLRLAGFTDQMHFLFGIGILAKIEAMGGSASTETEALLGRLLIKKLILPGRMGDIFKVLIQYKGLEEKPDLSGLKKDIFI